MVRFAIVIPTYHQHIPALVSLLSELKNQTRVPDIVSISASSVSLQDIEELSGSYPFKCILSATSEKRNAAENRNLASAAAIEAGADIVSFFDSDDTMHPRRTEIVEAAFVQNPEVDVLVHECTHSDWNLPWDTLSFPAETCEVVRDIVTFKYEELYYAHENTIVPFHRILYEEINGREPVTQNAHVSVRRTCVETTPQKTNAVGYEDSLFLSDLLKANYEIGLLPYRLSSYTMRP